MGFETQRTDSSWIGAYSVLQPDGGIVATPSTNRTKITPRTYIYKEGECKAIFHPFSGCGYENIATVGRYATIDKNGDMKIYLYSESFYRWVELEHHVSNYVSKNIPPSYNSQSNWRNGPKYYGRRAVRREQRRMV